MNGVVRHGLPNDGNGLPRVYRLPTLMGDIMSDHEESPEPTTFDPIAFLKQMGIPLFSEAFWQRIEQIRTLLKLHPELIGEVQAAIHNALRSAVPDDATSDEPESANDFGISLETEFLIRDDKGESQAMLYFEEVDPEPSDGPTMWIDSFSVAKALRGKGVGTALMRRFLERHGASHTIFLRVRPFNDAPMSRDDLRHFYEKWGFLDLPVPTVMVRYPNVPIYMERTV